MVPVTPGTTEKIRELVRSNRSHTDGRLLVALPELT